MFPLHACVHMQLLKTHSGNDNYTERHVQTINDAPKFKLVQTEALKSKVCKLEIGGGEG